MTDSPGRVWALIRDWLDTFDYKPPSQNELAPRFGVSPSSLTDYKYARSMPPPAFVVLVAQETQVPYEKVLNAVLEDQGYRGESLEELRADLIAAKDRVAARRDARGKHQRRGPREQRGD